MYMRKQALNNEGVDKIIKKVKGLLAIAHDNKNDEESQTAFLMAQKLLIKHKISMSDVEDINASERTIQSGQATTHKKLFWWERELANIIEKNFPVKWYYNSRVLDGESRKKRAIVFMGYEDDVALAKEMYILAYDVILFYTKEFVNQEQNKYGYWTREDTLSYKNSYMKGFLDGLKKKFEEQRLSMSQEYGLMVITPVEVKDKYDEMFKDSKGISFKIPPTQEVFAYKKGYEEGENVDYTKSTLDGELEI